MNKQELKNKAIEAIDRAREDIIRLGDDIFNNPELGFKEHKTAGKVRKIFDELALPYQDSLAVTGIKAVAKGRKSGFKAAVLGELDAVVCPQHPEADPATGAAHSCGHNAQIASMIGAAIGLVKGAVMPDLDGDAVFMAVPAEEYVELEYRQKLKEEDVINLFGGKQELIRRGVFDDVDFGMMVHSHARTPEQKLMVDCDSSGFTGKIISYSGREAHAGAAPHQGVNALNAAMLGMMGIHAQRETFQEKDRVRVHPIITKGGDLVNIVPADVRMETYVRAKSIEAVMDAGEKVNRALKAGAYAIGAEVEITEIPGYLPLIQNPAMTGLFTQNAKALIGEENIIREYELMGATDAGDVSSIMPFIHLSSGGFSGTAHSKDFHISDPEAAYIIPAKAMAMTVIDLLYDDAKTAREIKQDYQPELTKEEYLQFWDELLKN